jgi:hypothetical protein
VTTPEILEDRRISAKSIAEQLGISRERVGSIIHKDLDMRKSRYCEWRKEVHFCACCISRMAIASAAEPERATLLIQICVA